MENYEKCWRQSPRTPTASGKFAAMIQERGANAKRTQADLRESMRSSSSQELRATVKPDATFSSEQGTG